MEYFKSGNLNDTEELQRLSQTAYMEALQDLMDKEDMQAYVKRKYSLELLELELCDLSNHFLLFYMNHKMVGYMKYFLEPNSLKIDRLYILKSFKGKGIGSKFMNKAEAFAKLNGVKALTLGVLEINKPAILFYTKKGFVPYSCEMVLIGRNNYPLILMKKDLSLKISQT